jgi:hypothetical protein
MQRFLAEQQERITGLEADLDTERAKNAALAAGLRAAEDQLAEKGQLVARLLREREEFWIKLNGDDASPPTQERTA